ncbi:MAG: ferrochelatase [Alphaproteobacteria bacterium RIFOXYD12_FULL_60_8]|nr:MAG: ferrochelatase [Alphaproteobacteria bacterium RIFOXYD12_FULL_60_8]
MSKTAVVLFNLGGPDRPQAVRPFLFNLFNDPAIIGAPAPIRWLLAKYISAKRAPVAREIYRHLGGKSPLLDLTRDQASTLEEKLGGAFRVFVCMRYWHPMTPEVVRQVKEYAPERIVLLPLYPQYSTATTGSSFTAWAEEAQHQGLSAPTVSVCCYPTHPDFIAAVADLILEDYHDMTAPRVLFSAHGLPKKTIAAGDPYQHHVEQTAQAVVAKLGLSDLDWTVCYQSRVGPLEWIGPSTEDEIKRAGAQKKELLVVPIAFVSEHSETLVELDIEYRHLADEVGVPAYGRVGTVCDHPLFIQALADLVHQALDSPTTRRCPSRCVKCPTPETPHE